MTKEDLTLKKIREFEETLKKLAKDIREGKKKSPGSVFAKPR